MKIKFYVSTFIALLMLVSCSRSVDSPTGNGSATPNEINDFVWKAMNSWYYWQPNVPILAENAFKSTTEYANFINGKTPDALFYSLLYNRGTVDRFSWIENNNVIIRAGKVAEIEKAAGFDYGLYPVDNANTRLVALVNYVVPNSPAATAGLKRGDVITKINGSYITSSNAANFYNDQYTITLAATVTLTPSALVTTDQLTNINITQANIDENPVAFYKKFVYGSKNIGYLVYNGFKSDYNDELNAAFAQMKGDNLTDFILDLRYNGGGSLETAAALAQMINGSFTGSPYVYLTFNSKHTAENGAENLKNTVNIYNLVNNYPTLVRQEAVNSLTLPKIYVLVTFQTASASELTVTCLNKFINVVTIGDETVGKFVGSITLYDSPAQDYTSYTNRNKSHNWQLQPITFSYTNKDKDPAPTGGIMPNYSVNPYTFFNNIKEFGVTSDPSLKKALELITGMTINRVSAQTTSTDINLTSLKANNPTEAAQGLYIQDFNRFRK